MKKKTILVTGGAGYIGSHTVDYLVNHGFKVVVVDNLSTGHVEAINKKAKFYQGDVRDYYCLDKIFEREQIDGVIHFASVSIVPESMKNPLKYFDDNVKGTINLLRVMHKNHVNNIVFSSSAATYGEPRRIPIKEIDPQIPTNPYGQSKLMMENIMKWCHKAYGLNFVALRYFNVGGAKLDGSIGEDHNPETHLIPIILQTALGQRKVFQIFGTDYPTKDGTNVRDYVHVEDLANAHMLAMKYLMHGGKSTAFNLGSSHGFSNLQMVKEAKKITNKNFPVKAGARRAGDPSTLIADSSKARKVLKWRPKYTNVKDIIASAWKWTKRHPKGYDDRRFC